MPLIETVQDAFTDNVVSNPPWSDNYGGATEVGGRARVPCATSGAYAAYQSSHTYTFLNSYLFCEVPTTPAAGGAAVEAYAAMIVGSAVAGTSVGFIIHKLQGNLRMQSNVDYWDAAAVVIPYDSTAHRWLRVDNSGGNTFWKTSPDGVNWTTRRTLASPAWVATDTTCYVDLSSRRDSGTTDYSEFDNVNLAPSAGGGSFTGFGIPL